MARRGISSKNVYRLIKKYIIAELSGSEVFKLDNEKKIATLKDRNHENCIIEDV